MGSGAETSRLVSAVSRVLRHKALRPVVRVVTNMHVLAYRLTGGRAQLARYPTLLLTVPGRKTGRLRTTPLIYVADGERLIIAAAYSGSDQQPTWWLNLQRTAEALVQVRHTTMRVRAVVAAPHERERLWARLVTMYPYFTEYQERTQRVIPVVVLDPIATA